MEQSERFGTMLAEAMKNIARYQRRSMQAIQEEIAISLGRESADAIYFWRKGNIPDLDTLEKLTREIHDRSDLGQNWIREFLHYANHPSPEGFCRRLFHGQSIQSSSLSSFAPSILHLPKFYRSFIGRQESINQIITVLSDPNAPRMVGIDGIGGIGKSALAFEVADTCLERQLCDHVVFFNARTYLSNLVPTATYENIINVIARELDLSEIVYSNPLEGEQRIRTVLQQKRVLLLLDNLETASEPQARLLERVAPLLGLSRALLTSRQRFWGDVYPINLQGLSGKSAHQFIEQEVRDKGIAFSIKPDSTDLEQIVEATGGSPLAMKLVIGQLRLLPIAPALTSLRNFKTKNTNDEDENFALFQAIYLPSWNRLSHPARKLLFCVSLFSPNSGGDFEALTAISNITVEVAQSCIRDLWRVSFLEIRQKQNGIEDKRYLLHTLTHYFVRSQQDVFASSSSMAEEGGTHATSSPAQAVMLHFTEYFSRYLQQHQHDYQELDIEQENLFESLRYRIAQADVSLMHDVILLVPYALTRGFYRQIKEALEIAIQIAEISATVDELATLHLQLGTVLMKQGQIENAVLLFSKGIENYQKIQDQTLACDLFCTLAEAESERGDFDIANHYLKQSIEIAQRIQAQQQYGRALLLQGRVAIFSSQPELAKVYLSQALTVADALQDEYLRAMVVRNLSTVAGMTSDFEMAEQYSRSLLEYAEQKRHRELIGVALRNLSGSLAMRGEIEQAERYARRGLEIAKEIGNLEHASGIYLNLGVMATSKKMWQKALEYTLEALPLARQMGVPERLRSTLANLTHFYLELNKPNEATTCLREATELTEQIETAWATADTKFVWGRYYLKQKNFSAAKDAFSMACQVASQAMIREIEADSLRYLAEIASLENDLDTAKRLGQASLEIMYAIDYVDKDEMEKWLNDLSQS